MVRSVLVVSLSVLIALGGYAGPMGHGPGLESGVSDAATAGPPGGNPSLDVDADGLTDEAERKRQTDSDNTDTDGDGFTDAEEVRMDERLPGADPTVKDVYVEVDRMEGTDWLDPAVEARIRADFATSSVDDGDGIRVHFVRDDTVPATAISIQPAAGPHNDWAEYLDRYADRRREGYYHLLLARELPERVRTGMYWEGAQAMIVEDLPSDWRGPVVEHEIVHAVSGLDRTTYRGVDSERVPYDEYPSVMNYNAFDTSMDGPKYGLSNGTGSPGDFDDWEYVETHFREPDTTGLPAVG